MFVHDRLTESLDELESVAAQVRQARGRERSTRMYELIRLGDLEDDQASVAAVIELDRGWCLVHWLLDQREIWLCRSQSLMSRTLCSPYGRYRLSLIDASEELPREATSQRTVGLTESQRNVLRLLGHGLSNREIAAELVIGEQAVKNLVSGVLAELGVDTRLKAGLLARDLDLA